MGNPYITPQTAVILCAVTYVTDPQTTIGEYLPGWKIVWNGIETEDGNYAFIATDADNSVYALAIRGSLPPKEIFTSWDAFANWVLEDLDVITQDAWPYATTANPLIANGTNTAFNNVANMQDSFGSAYTAGNYLSSYAVANNIPVIIAGHSLGGNIANVFSSYFVTAIAAVNNFTETYLYTFAAPAAGNSDFATDLDNKLVTAWHYENDNDIIPKFPVFLTMIIAAALYIPAPSSGGITVTYKGVTISLREAFIGLAILLEPYGYQQQADNYTVFPNNIDEQYTANTIGDYFYQVGYQHGLDNYAAYLGITLPLDAVEKSRLV